MLSYSRQIRAFAAFRSTAKQQHKERLRPDVHPISRHVSIFGIHQNRGAGVGDDCDTAYTHTEW